MNTGDGRVVGGLSTARSGAAVGQKKARREAIIGTTVAHQRADFDNKVT